MKSKKAFLNVVVNTMAQIVNVILAFAVRKVFLMTLGEDILGLNSLFSSILAFLTLSELGLGVSTAMCLYKPLAEEDTEKVTAYMNLLSKLYSYIGIIILVCGALFVPFLGYVVNGDYENKTIVLGFVLYLSATAVSYFFSAKKVLLGADQKSYIVSAGQLIYKIVLNVSQIIILWVTSNYFLFLLVSIVCNFFENYILSRICIKQYPYIQEKVYPLSKEEKKNLYDKVKGMLCYKVSNYFIEGTDNIIISTFLGTVYVAYYSNYYLVINMLYAIFACFGTSAIAGLGNILNTSLQQLKNAFSKLLMVQHLVYSFSTVALIILASDFVKMFFGEQSVLGYIVVLLMAAVYYIKGYSQGLEALRNSAGLYTRDRFINLAIALLNVIVSILLIIHIGLSGVLAGTLICYILKEFVVLPIIVFDEVLVGERKWYFKTCIKHFCVTLTIAIPTILVHEYIYAVNEYVTWILNGIICFCMAALINYIIFRKTEEMKQLLSTLKSMIKRKI